MFHLSSHISMPHISDFVENGNVLADGGRTMTRHRYCYTQNDNVTSSIRWLNLRGWLPRDTGDLEKKTNPLAKSSELKMVYMCFWQTLISFPVFFYFPTILSSNLDSHSAMRSIAICEIPEQCRCTVRIARAVRTGYRHFAMTGLKLTFQPKSKLVFGLTSFIT